MAGMIFTRENAAWLDSMRADAGLQEGLISIIQASSTLREVTSPCYGWDVHWARTVLTISQPPGICCAELGDGTPSQNVPALQFHSTAEPSWLH